ncbi:hypothetical protein TNCV_3314751 [Trichonephila clavipes]|nr:hypothetical protein TNCV_3314751 [Trichonephila clavipes]
MKSKRQEKATAGISGGFYAPENVRGPLTVCFSRRGKREKRATARERPFSLGSDYFSLTHRNISWNILNGVERNECSET